MLIKYNRHPFKIFSCQPRKVSYNKLLLFAFYFASSFGSNKKIAQKSTNNYHQQKKNLQKPFPQKTLKNHGFLNSIMHAKYIRLLLYTTYVATKKSTKNTRKRTSKRTKNTRKSTKNTRKRTRKSRVQRRAQRTQQSRTDVAVPIINDKKFFISEQRNCTNERTLIYWGDTNKRFFKSYYFLWKR